MNKTTPTDRNTIIRDIIKIYVEVTQYFTPEQQSSLNEHTKITKEFKIDSDDLSYAIAEIYRYFSIAPSQEELDGIWTVGDMADLVIKHNGHAKEPYTIYEPVSAFPEWIKKPSVKLVSNFNLTHKLYQASTGTGIA